MANITNVVVLMLENRSYDNVLGALSLNPNGCQQSLNGLTGNETNPDPNKGPAIVVHSTDHAVTLGGSGPAYPPTSLPFVDPGEPFNDMAQQFLSLDEPPDSNPYVDYDPNAAGLMQGFTTNYARQLSCEQADNVKDIMNYLTPEQLPVTAFLAENFGVCDQWFASAPTHTFTNRTFAVLAAPAVAQQVHLITRQPEGEPFSYMDDPQYLTDLVSAIRVRSTSIFEQLDTVYPEGKGSASAPNWRVYFHDYPIAVISDPYTFDIAVSESNQNVATFDDTDFGGKTPFFLGNLPSGTFVGDVQKGLPKFSFIEPRYNMQSTTFSGAKGDLLPNCAHPGRGNLISFRLLESEPTAAVNIPSDAASSELLLLRVYNMLQASPNWATTLFIVTFDEPGGTYDHVPPLKAKSPGVQFPAAKSFLDHAADGFDWTVLGGRVPAIIISPMIEKCSRVRATESQNPSVEAPFDHTSIIRTVWEAFNLTQGSTTSLTDRDAAAPSLIGFCGASNDTGPFIGTIICAPSALVFLGNSTLMFYASAGPAELAAVMNDRPSWVKTFDQHWDSATSLLTVVVGVEALLLTGELATSFEVEGAGLPSVTVPVTLSGFF
jgi:phospholipase C